MALRPVSLHQTTCSELSRMNYAEVSMEDNTKQQIKDTWNQNIGIEKVYKNFDFSTEYEMIVSEGSCEKSEYPYKSFQVYPYDDFIFDKGDYVSFVYKGRMTHFLISSANQQFAYQVKGRMYLCNNMLKYVDDYGKLYELPCVFNDKAQRTDFYYTNSVNIVDGRVEVDVQKNRITNMIDENTRFLFDGKAFKVSYVGNHNNNFCDDSKNDIGTTTFMMVVDQLQGIHDDKENNIANVDKMNTYTLEVIPEIINGNVDNEGEIIAKVYKNNQEIDEEIGFEIIENESNQSESEDCGCDISAKYPFFVCECEKPIIEPTIEINQVGEYKLLNVGTAKVKVYMKNNSDIYKILDFNVSEKPKEDIIKIIIEPNITEVCQRESQTYKCYKIVNGKKTNEKLIIEDVSDIKKGHYTILIDEENNEFTLENIKKHNSKLVNILVHDNSGISQKISIKLGDEW